jgi:hypothetical protein
VRTRLHEQSKRCVLTLDLAVFDGHPRIEVAALDIEGLQLREVRLNGRFAISCMDHVAVPDARNRRNNALVADCLERSPDILFRKHSVALDFHILDLDRVAGLHVNDQIHFVLTVGDQFRIDNGILETLLDQLVSDLSGDPLRLHFIDRRPDGQVGRHAVGVGLDAHVVQIQLRFWSNVKDDSGSVPLFLGLHLNVGELAAGPQRANVLADIGLLHRVAHFGREPDVGGSAFDRDRLDVSGLNHEGLRCDDKHDRGSVLGFFRDHLNIAE